MENDPVQPRYNSAVGVKLSAIFLTQTMSAGTGTYRALGPGKIEMLSDLPMIGPSPGQQFVAVSAKDGGGHGQIRITFATPAVAISAATPVPMLGLTTTQLWPRVPSDVIGARDSTGLLPIPPVAIVGPSVNIGTVLNPCHYLKGTFKYTFTATTGVANPTAPATHTNAFFGIDMTATDNLAITQASHTDFPNIANNGSSNVYSATLNFCFPNEPLRTNIVFSIIGNYIDGGAASLTVISVLSGDSGLLIEN